LNVQTHSQLALNFEVGLTTRFRRLEDCINHTVLNYSKGMEAVASALDQSPSELSRRLNAHLAQKEGEANNRPLRVSDMVGTLEETKDYRPIFWLIEKFLRDPEVQRTQAIHELSKVMPYVQALIEQAGIQAKAAKR
jgi:hypothetical protein